VDAFHEGLEELLKYEGGYSKDPRDSGGETFKGISRRYFPKWEGWSIIDVNHFDPRLDDLVAQFYKQQFWDKLLLDEVSNGEVAKILFNFSVNIGKKQITKKVQRILHVTIDGSFGPQTLNALNEFCTSNSNEFVYHLLLEVVELYVQIVNKNRTQKVFLLGWLNRVIRTYYSFERTV